MTELKIVKDADEFNLESLRLDPSHLEPFRKELESRESLVIPWTAPDSEVPHVEAGTSSGGGSARPALRE